MARSLALKLTLAFLVISLMGVALVAGLIRQSTQTEFDRFLLSQRQSDFVDYSTAYYEETNSWDGVERVLQEQRLLPPPGQTAPPTPQNLESEQATLSQDQQPDSPPPVWEQPIVLADARGFVVVAGGPFEIGDRAPRDVLDGGVEIRSGGRLVGTVLDMAAPPDRHPAEVRYLERTNQALLQAALAAGGIAVVLGLALARTLTHPLQELTAAVRRMGEGSLKQPVPVRSHDELGELAGAINQMSADLDRSNELRRQMIADIAHDLRTPLTVIKGYTEALRDGDLPPMTGTFQTMFQEAELLSYLIDDLRTLSLADAGELALNYQPLAPRELMERTASGHLAQAQQAEVALQVEADEALPLVRVDPERMAQVLGNLVSNALRYTPAGGEITLGAARHGDDVHLIVQDTGAGIAPEHILRIFDRFYRGETARQVETRESGLGLSIAKSLVELQGGTIGVSSKLGNGTTFTIILPGQSA